MPSKYIKKSVTTARTAEANSWLFGDVSVVDAIPDRSFQEWQQAATDMFLALPPNGVMTVKSPRQHGKTYWLESLAVYCAVSKPEQTVIVISPVNSQNSRLYENIKYMLYEDERVDKMLGLPEMQICFRNGSRIYFKSAETKDRLRGFTANVLIIDEGAYVDDDVYNIVLPYLNVPKGRLVITSTPRYKAGEFYRSWERGLKDNKDIFFAINVTDYPEEFFISDSQKEQYKAMMPPSSYKTEIDGLFLDNDEGLFGDFSSCISKVITDISPVWVGIDWAGKGADKTILTAINERNEVCEIKEWGVVDSVRLVSQIAAYINEHPTIARCLVEDNSIGAVYLDMLRQELDNPSVVQAFNTNASSKGALIDNLAALFGRNGITIPDNPELEKQLSLFTATLMDTGKVTYAGANGSHDDYVMSLGFAAWNIRVNKAQYAVRII